MEKSSSIQDLENISASVNEDGVKEIVETKYDFKVEKIKKLDGYDDLNFYVVPLNGTSLTESWPNGFVLKIINWRDSKEDQFFNEYINVLLHLRKEGLVCPCPIINKEGKYFSYWIDLGEQNQCNKEEPKSNLIVRRHIILLLSYLPGDALEKIGYNEKIIFNLGRLLSQLHIKLQLFSDSQVLHRPNFMWSLMFVPELTNLLNVVVHVQKRSLILKIVKEFKEHVLSNLDLLEKGVIHGDVNYNNVLVQKQIPGQDNLEICGIIDFTDMHISCCLFDIALAACYLSLSHIDRYEDAISLFLLGYQSLRQITNLEFHLLKVCVCARLCQSIVLGLKTLITNPQNDYIKNSTSMLHGWSLLNKLSEINNEEFIDVLNTKMNNFRCKFEVVGSPSL